ncbi:hypothetical protein Gotur_014161, partial [Gossypium turneri]
CLSLLQSWAWFRFPFLRPRVNHPYTFSLVTRWNHLASYRGLPSELEDIRLLLDQRSEAEFQWTLYEDLTIQAVIPEEFLQNPNAWHAKVVLINYATVEPHQTDRVLRQFGCRQPIPTDPEVFDDHHKIDLRLLACVPKYMPWFRIHGKPYLLTPEERQRQICVGRESPTVCWSQMPGSDPFPIMPSGPPISRPAVQEGSQGGPSVSSLFYQSPPTYGFQTPSPFMMQTPPHTLFFEGGSSSQVRQPDAESEELESPPEEEQPPPEARGRRNPVRNRRRPPCGTE